MWIIGVTAAWGQVSQVTGHVIDEYGQPLTGVTVVATAPSGASSKGTAVTDRSGKYTVKTEPADRLLFEFLGYESTTETVGQRTTINVTMRGTVMNMDSVVVVGYGTQRKIDLTGSVTTLSGEELTRMPVTNVFEALSGKVAGMQVINTSEPGSAPTVQIRGVGSFNDSSPICIIDDMFFEVSELANINPNDIESLTVLKDASATAIYGVRGAGGVIIIKTKQGSGEKGRTSVSAGAYYSVSEMQRYLPMCDQSQWQQFQNLQYLANNYNNPAAIDKIPYPEWQTAGKGTDWQRLVSQHGKTQSYNLSISGNTPTTTYYFSGSYLDQSGVIKYTGYNRFTGKANVSFKPYKWLKLALNSTYIYDNQVAMEKQILTMAGKRPPDAPIFVDPNEQEVEDNFSGGDNNPYALLYYTHDRFRKSNKLLATVYAEFSILKNLTFRTSYANTSNSIQEKVFLPAFMENVASSSSDYTVSRLRHNVQDNNTWLQENLLTWNFQSRGHRIDAVAGLTFQNLKTQYLNTTAIDMPWAAWKNRNMWYLGQSNSHMGTAADGGTDKTYASWLYRATYSYKNRYTATLTGRADASSYFPPNGRWAFFPAAGVGWIASQEKFLKRERWLDLLKLKASYGVVGNDKGVPPSVQRIYADPVPVVMGQDNNVVVSNKMRQTIDQSLTWERTTTFNGGFELGVFKNLLTVDMEYYYKRTGDLIMPLENPITHYTTSYRIGTVRNRGIELTLGYKPRIGQVQTNFQGTLTTLDNKVLSIAEAVGGINDVPNRTLEGYPIGSLWGYQTIGVFQNEDQVAQMPKISGSRPGDLIFRDVNGDGLIDVNDLVYLGSYLPKVMIGFSAGAQWRGFSLNVDLSSSLGHKSFNKRLQLRQQNQNPTTQVLKAWTGEGTSNVWPRTFVNGDASSQPSDFFIEDDSYVTINNVQLAYNFPKRWINRLNITSAKVYVTGSNLYTWTKCTGYRPDFPPRGTTSADPSVDGSGNANSGGLDYFGQYPYNRIFTVGLSFGF